MKKLLLKAFAASVCALLFTTNLSAQTTTEVHSQMHRNMLADHINMAKEFNLLDSLASVYKLQNELDQFPALDLYDSWDDSSLARALGVGVKIPDSMRIDVSKYVPPTTGHVTSNFGWRRRRMHKGIDLKVQVGDTIRSAFDGKIRIRKYERRGYGYYLVVRHSNGLETVYGHLSKFLVEQDQLVKAGEPIALGGNTGRSTGAHLHFETRFMGVVINPNEIIDFKNYVAHTDTYLFQSKRSQAIATGSMGPDGIAYHRVKSGDTLGAIARRYGVSVDRICRYNNISKTSTLRIGQRLRYS